MIAWIFNNSYNLLLALGGVSVIFLMIIRRSTYELSILQASVFSFILLFLAVVGSKLLYILENHGDTSGMSLFGAVFLILIVIPLVGKAFRLNGNMALDACAPCGASVIGFVRFGCFITGCCGGRQISVSGCIFQYPTQIIESLCDFIILGLLLQKEKTRHTYGSLYAWFLILYCLLRFLIEFLRDTPKDWFSLSHGQWFSIIGFILGITVHIYAHRTKEETHEEEKKRK